MTITMDHHPCHKNQLGSPPALYIHLPQEEDDLLRKHFRACLESGIKLSHVLCWLALSPAKQPMQQLSTNGGFSRISTCKRWIDKYQWYVSVDGTGVLAKPHFSYCFAAAVGGVDGYSGLQRIDFL